MLLAASLVPAIHDAPVDLNVGVVVVVFTGVRPTG